MHVVHADIFEDELKEESDPCDSEPHQRRQHDDVDVLQPHDHQLLTPSALQRWRPVLPLPLLHDAFASHLQATIKEGDFVCPPEIHFAGFCVLRDKQFLSEAEMIFVLVT